MDHADKSTIRIHPIIEKLSACAHEDLVEIRGYVGGAHGSTEDGHVAVFQSLDRAVRFELPLDAVAHVEDGRDALEPNTLLVDANAEVRIIERRVTRAPARDVCFGCVPELGADTDFCARISAMIGDLEFDLEHGGLSSDQKRRTEKSLATARYAQTLLCKRSGRGIV